MDTSWNKSSNWYNKIVGEGGHYYHRKIIIPNVLRLLNLGKDDKLLDLGCGQGVLERAVGKEIEYLGIDMAKSLLEAAYKNRISENHNFMLGDVSRNLNVKQKFTKAAIILALQNIAKPFLAIRNVKNMIVEGGGLVVVLNHPCFRIPQKSGWDVKKGVQRRYEEVYMKPQKLELLTNPGKKDSETTLSFHYPLSAYAEMLSDNGFVIQTIEEWVSDKKSTGPMARMEDSARDEFPLFMAIAAVYQKQRIPV